jgi:hypothetical protein
MVVGLAHEAGQHSPCSVDVRKTVLRSQEKGKAAGNSVARSREQCPNSAPQQVLMQDRRMGPLRGRE